MLNPQKITINNQDFEWAAAEVISVDYENLDPSRQYSILCRFLSTGGSKSPTDAITARALNSNIKHIPIKGEIVMVCQAPTAYHNGLSYGREYFYTNPVAIQSSVHHNGLPGAGVVQADPRTDTQKANSALLGLPKKLATNVNGGSRIDPTFPERLDVYPLQPFSGDIIFEGRWGQSIRFGSTVDTRRPYPFNPNWTIGSGGTGNPITIISNGSNPQRTPNKPFNQFHVESPDNDDASIWLTSGQSVKFTIASKYTPSIFDKEIGLFRKNYFAGNQLIMASDRIIFNANKQEIVGFAKEGIGFATEKTLALNGGNIVELEGGKISIGFNATSPIILGDRLLQLLHDFMKIIVDMNTSITKTTVPTGVGPSGTPLNSGEFVDYVSKIKRLSNTLPTLASKFAFVNEFSGGPNDADAEKHRKSKSNGYVIELSDVGKGSEPTNVTFNSQNRGF